MPAPTPVANFIDALTKFIPADMLTIYVSVLAFLYGGGVSGTTFDGGWYPHVGTNPWDFWLVIVLLICTPLWVIGLRYVATPTGQPYIWPIWASIAGLVAFYVYVMCLEDVFTPSTGHTALFGVVAILVSPVLGFANLVVTRRWPSQGVP